MDAVARLPRLAQRALPVPTIFAAQPRTAAVSADRIMSARAGLGTGCLLFLQDTVTLSACGYLFQSSILFLSQARHPDFNPSSAVGELGSRVCEPVSPRTQMLHGGGGLPLHLRHHPVTSLFMPGSPEPAHRQAALR